MLAFEVEIASACIIAGWVWQLVCNPGTQGAETSRSLEQARLLRLVTSGFSDRPCINIRWTVTEAETPDVKPVASACT